MKNTSEFFQFACQCLILDEYSELKEGIKNKFVSGEVDLDKFVYLCSNHFILPVIYLRLKNAELLEIFPDEYASHLKEIYELNRKRNTEILQQIEEISAKLQKANIKPIYLKGTANLMDGLYDDIGVRMIGDIDFLVQEKDYLKTAELILGLGYENQHKMWDDAITFKHYPRLFRKDVPADIEIHRVPVNIPLSKQFNTELLFQNKKEIKQSINPLLNSSINEINHLKDIPGQTTKTRNLLERSGNPNLSGQPVTCNTFVSSNEHKLIHTFIHSQLSNKGYQRKIVGLRDLYDTYLLLKRVDLESVLPQIEENKKARQFFEYVNYLFISERNQVNSEQKLPNKFAANHQWFFNHPRWHRIYLTLIDFYELIIIRYLWRIMRVPFQKSSFIYLKTRLKDPEWYKMHFNELKKSFFS